MTDIAIQITRFVDDDFPGFVECVLIDASGASHIFIEKGPRVSSQNLIESSTYPCTGSIECTVENEWVDGENRSLACINTDPTESADGEIQFTVFTSQILRDETDV